MLPFGIIEKHGPQLPLGTDLINVRYAVTHAVEQEYAVVFPEYYFGQIFEARHEPGTMAYSAKMQLELLQETTDEMGRNGCKKIVIVNGHGGNNHLLPFFAQSQMAAPHDYVVYVHSRADFPPGRPPLKTKTDSHAGESETAHTHDFAAGSGASGTVGRGIGRGSQSSGFAERASIRESGGTRNFPIITRATARPRRRSWANSI